eukprot:387526-Pelagomonas_calceolata.AAC.1
MRIYTNLLGHLGEGGSWVGGTPGQPGAQKGEKSIGEYKQSIRRDNLQKGETSIGEDTFEWDCVSLVQPGTGLRHTGIGLQGAFTHEFNNAHKPPNLPIAIARLSYPLFKVHRPRI